MSENNPQVSSWVSLWGKFEVGRDEVAFIGYPFLPEAPKTASVGGTDAAPPAAPAARGGVGKAVCNQRLTDGSVSVDIVFDDIDSNTTAEIILHQNPVTEEMVTVGLGANGFLINVRQWTRTGALDGNQQQTGIATENIPHWRVLRKFGERSALKPGQTYHLDLRVKGSYLTLELDKVEVGSGSLPFQLTGNQVGFFCQSLSNIHFRHFRLDSVRPLAFVVMQFSPPEYEELFNDVITPVCDQMGLEAFRASQTNAPGLVIGDIQRQIRESRVVIAEITPNNANVYYEVGYADAIGKPVILIADGGKLGQLPFDVRAFRTIFYENTIGGKMKVEKTLTEFLRNLTSQK